MNVAENHTDMNRFKLALRDFLIQLREFSAGESADTTDLFVEEKEAEARQKQQDAARIPGMLKPSQMEDNEDL